MRNIRPLVSSYPDEYATSGLGSDGRGSIISASSYEHSSLSASETQLFCMTSERFCVHKDTVHCRKTVYWHAFDPELRCAWTQCVSYTMIRARFDVRWFINSLSVDVYILYIQWNCSENIWCMKKSLKWPNVVILWTIRVNHCAMHSQAFDMIMCCTNQHLAFILKTNLVTRTFCNWLQQQVTVLITFYILNRNIFFYLSTNKTFVIWIYLNWNKCT